MGIINTNETDLNQLAQGQAALLFGKELEKVLRNIDDPNTEATAKRKVILSVTFIPAEDRRYVRMQIDTDSKLAKTTPVIKTSGMIGLNNLNELVISEFGENQIPGQMQTKSNEFNDVVVEETEPTTPVTKTGFRR